VKVKAKILQVHTTPDGRLIAKIQFNSKLPPVGALCDVRWGAKRSLSQNALYWAYLTFLIEDCGLKDHGHFDPQALHDNLKAHFLSEKVMDKGQFKVVETGSTAELNKVEFGEYLQKIDDFVCDFFEISTADFWQAHDKI